jgi:predicted dehydrogenase
VVGRQLIGPTGVDDLFTGSLVFPDGVHAVFDCGLRMPNRATLEAVGTDGSLFVDDPWLCRRRGIELRRRDGLERIPVEAADSYRLELDDLARAVAGEAKPLLGRADAVGQARVLSALRRSAVQSIPLRP